MRIKLSGRDNFIWIYWRLCDAPWPLFGCWSAVSFLGFHPLVCSNFYDCVHSFFFFLFSFFPFSFFFVAKWASSQAWKGQHPLRLMCCHLYWHQRGERRGNRSGFRTFECINVVWKKKYINKWATCRGFAIVAFCFVIINRCPWFMQKKMFPFNGTREAKKTVLNLNQREDIEWGV